jgi:hypothetical protein
MADLELISTLTPLMQKISKQRVLNTFPTRAQKLTMIRGDDNYSLRLTKPTHWKERDNKPVA